MGMCSSTTVNFHPGPFRSPTLWLLTRRRRVTFQLQNILNYGTRTPAVARTSIQARDIIQFIKKSEQDRKKAMDEIHDLMIKLVFCIEQTEPLRDAIKDAEKASAEGSLVLRTQPNVLRPPSIPNLESKAASFLQGAKLALAQATRIVKPLYGQDFGHQLNKMEKWAKSSLGEQHRLVGFARDWQPWVKNLLAMRDAVDHPTDKPRGRLVVRNFHVQESADALTLIGPQWSLSGAARVKLLVASSMQPLADYLRRPNAP